MPYILLSTAVLEALLKHAKVISLPLVEVFIIFYLIARIQGNSKISVAGASSFYILSALWVLMLWLFLFFYSEIESSGYFTFVPKLLIIPFIAEYFLSNKKNIKMVYFTACLMFILSFFVESNPLAIGQFINKNEFGHYVLCFLCMTSLSLSQNKIHNNENRIFVLFVFLIASTIALIYSRQFVVAIFLGLVFVNIRFKLLPLIKVAIICSVSYFGLIFFVRNILSGYEQKRLETLLTWDISTRADFKRWDNITWALSEFSNSPWIGHGLGSFRSNSPTGLVAHNTYLSIFYELGFFGMIVVIAIVSKIVYLLIKLNSHKELAFNKYICVFVFALLAQATFQDVLAKFSMLILLAIPIILNTKLDRAGI